MRLNRFINALLLCVMAVSLSAVCLAGCSSSSNSKTSSNVGKNTATSLAPVQMPSNGAIFKAPSSQESEITVHAASGYSALVKLKSPSGADALVFFVRAGQTATVKAPAGTYYLYWATGETWYGEKELFGAGTSYAKDKDALDLSNYAYEFTLYTVSNGNMHQQKVSPNEF